MKKLGVVLLAVVVAVAAFLFFPRSGGPSIANAATLSVLHGQVDAQRAGGDFAVAYDGDLLLTGDTVRANGAGYAVISFFDGSTLTVEPGAQAKVVSLAKTGLGGMPVTIEQTLGRTWASVQKPGSDGTFEIRTPTATAVVRGTAFETIVETVNGVTTTTIKTTEGGVVVRAVAGGQTTVGPGQQVQVPQGAPVPANPTQQAPSPRLRFVPSAGVGLSIVDPRGLQCGAAVRQAPGCNSDGATVTIDDPVTGTYALALTAATAGPGASVTVDGTRGATADLSTKLSADLSPGDLVRTTLGISAPANGPLATTGFTAAERITSVCGAEATGRVFSSGAVATRGDALRGYAKQAPKQPASIVLSAAELTQAAADSVAEADLPVPVSDIAVTIDGAGIHASAHATAGPLTIPVITNVVAAARDGKLLLKTSSLDLGPVPGGIRDQLIATLDETLSDVGDSFPLGVERVAFRSGCLAVIGTTP